MELDIIEMRGHLPSIKTYSLEKIEQIYEEYKIKYKAFNKSVQSIELKTIEDLWMLRELRTVSASVLVFINKIKLEINKRLAE